MSLHQPVSVGQPTHPPSVAPHLWFLFSPSKWAERVAVLTFILEVSVPNLGEGIDYPEGFHRFPKSSHTDAGDCTSH